MLTIIAILLVPLTWYLLWRTSFGLRLRSCGENPQAAETLGINVYKYKYYGVVVSGALAGLGGAFLSMVASSIYREGQTAGRGYIGLATMIFGNWRPGRAGRWCGALRLHRRPAAAARQRVRARAAAAHRGRAAGGRRLAVRPRRLGRPASVSIGLARHRRRCGSSPPDEIPVEFVQAVPYVTTLVVLALASQRLRPPAADGLPYRRGGG